MVHPGKPVHSFLPKKVLANHDQILLNDLCQSLPDKNRSYRDQLFQDQIVTAAYSRADLSGQFGRVSEVGLPLSRTWLAGGQKAAAITHLTKREARLAFVEG